MCEPAVPQNAGMQAQLYETHQVDVAILQTVLRPVWPEEQERNDDRCPGNLHKFSNNSVLARCVEYVRIRCQMSAPSGRYGVSTFRMQKHHIYSN